MKISKVHTGRRAVKDIDPESSYNFPLRMTPEFRTRIRVAARFNGSTISQFIRDAVVARLEMSEARQRQARDEKRAEKERTNTFRGIGESTLAPSAPTPLRELVDKHETPPTDVLPKDLYRENAKRIAAALDRPREMRLRLDEAVVAIKKQWPLTHPPEDQIIERFDKLVAAIVEKKVPTATKDDELLGKTLSGVKTYGYTPIDGDENE